MASCSSSHQQNEEPHAFSGIEPPGKRRKVDESSRLYDVFINHRGPDVKQTLATQLYNSLHELGIRAFLDSEEKELGYSFPSTIENAIRSALVHIAIFSKNYAQSPWCLAELVLMLQSQAKIIPVFYDPVEPWEVRYVEKGVYAEAFSDYEKKGRYLEKLKEWKEALQSVSFITGEEFNRFSDCKTIVSAVEKEIKRTKILHVAEYPVGLDRLVEEFERRSLDQIVKDFDRHCAMRQEMKDKAKIVGIFGMGGVGKTTLSLELFNRKKGEYTRRSFLYDVREASSTSTGLASLQSKLLKDLFGAEPPNFQSPHEGRNHLRDCLGRSKSLKFLIIIDDIDRVEQLDALSVKEMLNNSVDSLIIITTRDVGVLISAGIIVGYQLKGMDRNDGKELFCWHAFDQPCPDSGYEGLVDDFVGVCGGLPLSLQVLGRDVHCRTHKYWLSILSELSKTLPQDIVKKLRISFEALKKEEKQIFMDIACFFVNKPKSVAMRSWEGSGWSAHLALERLKDKCLVEEIEIWRLDGLPMWVWDQGTDLALRMHDHLRDLGREIAIELNHPRRLWCPQDLKSLESKGFHDILSQSQPKDRCFHSIFDQSMNCQITYFLGASDDSPQTSTSILWLQLDYLPLDLNASMHPDILSSIPLENLQCLRINNGHLERLWQRNVQAPSQLKELQIVGTSLEVFPDLSRTADNLEMVHIDAEKMSKVDWSLISSLNPRSLILTSSTLRGDLASDYSKKSNSASLSIWDFKGGKELAPNNSMSNLVSLEISNLKLLARISISCPNLKSLKLHNTEDLIEADFMRVTNVVVFDISDCHKLVGFSFSDGSCLQRIIIKNCTNLKRVSGISDLSKLVQLSISVCPVLELELSLVGMNCLESVTVNECRKLKYFQLSHCKNLKTVWGMVDLKELAILNICECPELEDLACLDGLSCLETITIDRCGRLNRIKFRSCENLKRLSGKLDLQGLDIEDCSEIPELLFDIGRQTCIQEICIYNCGKLRNILLPIFNLKKLEISECPVFEELSVAHLSCLEIMIIIFCQNLRRVSGISNLTKLIKLTIFECPELEELKVAHLSCLEIMIIVSCQNLRRVTGISYLTKLIELNISKCPEFELEELNVAYLSCLEIMIIKNCQNLRRVSGISDLTKLKELKISECPVLELELCLAGMHYLERIRIDRCGKLQCFELDASELLFDFRRQTCIVEISINECREFEELSVAHLSRLKKMTIENCQNLRRVSGISDLTKLKELKISECPVLEPELSLVGMNCLKYLDIYKCEKLQSISGIQQLRALKDVQLAYCSNAVMRNCIDMLQSVPSEFMGVIGRAAEEAESSLSPQLFEADAVIEIDPRSEDILQIQMMRAYEWSAVIVCAVVVVDSSTQLDKINHEMEYINNGSHPFYIEGVGEWIITHVITDQYRILRYFYDRRYEDIFAEYGIWGKGFWVMVKKSEEWKTLHVLKTIINRLHAN